MRGATAPAFAPSEVIAAENTVDAPDVAWNPRRNAALAVWSARDGNEDRVRLSQRAASPGE